MKAFLLISLIGFFQTLCHADINIWQQSISLGIHMAKGNNDVSLINANYSGEKKSSTDKVNLKLDSSFGSEKKNKTVNNYSAQTQYNRHFSLKDYWLYNASVEIDRIADLDHRLVTGPGLGRNIIKNSKSELDLEAGLSYLGEKFKRTAAENDIALRLANKVGHQLNHSAKIWNTIEYIYNTTKDEHYIIKGELGIETRISETMNLRSFAKETYNSRPANNKKSSDLSFATVIVYRF